MATLNIPGDQPDLATALAAAADGDTLVLHGEHEIDALRVDKPLTLSGGTLIGRGERILRLAADVTLRGITLKNPGGHGVVCMGGAPVLEDLSLSVQGTALACGGDTKPTLTRCKVQGATIGLTVQDDAVVLGEELVLVSRGSGAFFTGRASGTLSKCAISAGKMAAIEIAQQASPTLAGVAIIAGGAGGVFVHGQATPKLLGCLIQQVALAGLEVRDEARPEVDGLLIKEGQAGGLFLHGQSEGTYMEVEIDDCALAAIEISEQAKAELERGLVKMGRSGGLFVHGDARVEVLEYQIKDNAFQGIEVGGTAQVTVEDTQVTGAGSHGLFVQERGVLQLERCQVLGCGEYGVRASGAGVLGLIATKVAENVAGGLLADQSAQVFHKELDLTGTKQVLDNAAFNALG